MSGIHASSSRRPNCGLRRLPGMLRTSTNDWTLARSIRLVNSSRLAVPCPTVRSVSRDGVLTALWVGFTLARGGGKLFALMVLATTFPSACGLSEPLAVAGKVVSPSIRLPRWTAHRSSGRVATASASPPAHLRHAPYASAADNSRLSLRMS